MREIREFTNEELWDAYHEAIHSNLEWAIGQVKLKEYFLEHPDDFDFLSPLDAVTEVLWMLRKEKVYGRNQEK